MIKLACVLSLSAWLLAVCYNLQESRLVSLAELPEKGEGPTSFMPVAEHVRPADLSWGALFHRQFP